jgi:predicted dehydrogenase
LKVAIVGAGQVGAKRANAIRGHEVVACADVSLERAERLARSVEGCLATTDIEKAIARADVVVVATTHDALAPVALAAIAARRHILVEKPAARSAGELEPVVAAARESGVIAKVGFNHRFHPAFQAARRIVDAGDLGPLLYVRGRYGHGGRLGYESEWRADPCVSGGGELLDQGSHLIDLSRWFLGDFDDVTGHIDTYFWRMRVEDNAFAMLRTRQGQIAWLHASWTEWKNLFSFEIFGSRGKLQVDGLGGSYGTEKLTHYRMLPELGPPETVAWEYPGTDRSWEVEFDHFVQCIQAGTRPSGTLEDALASLRVVGRLYASAKQAQPVAGFETA